MHEHFPVTKPTVWWDQAPPRQINEFLMRTYAEPLRIYYRSMCGGGSADADDVVNGFFASRLQSDEKDFIRKWTVHKHQSEIRLRRWLINGLRFYVKERYRQCGKMHPSVDDVLEPVDQQVDPVVAAERAAIRAFIREALATTEEICRKKGLEDHLDAFRRRNDDGDAYRSIAEALGVTETRVVVMCRTVTRYFKRSLAEVLHRDGVDSGDVDAEINCFLECV